MKTSQTSTKQVFDPIPEQGKPEGTDSLYPDMSLGHGKKLP
jgi:hypothetical protein